MYVRISRATCTLNFRNSIAFVRKVGLRGVFIRPKKEKRHLIKLTRPTVFFAEKNADSNNLIGKFPSNTNLKHWFSKIPPKNNL